MNTKNKRIGFANRTLAIIAAVLIHAALIFFLVTNFNKPRESAVAKDADQIDTIMATTVSADEIKNQKKKIQKADFERKRKIEEQRKQEQDELDKIKQQKELAAKELEETKQKRIEEEKVIALKRKKEKELKEKERKRKAEELRKEELRKKKKAEEAKKEKRKTDRQKSLQNELSKEFNNESSDEKVANQVVSSRNTTTLFNKYVALIAEKVRLHFNAPLGSPVGMEAVVNVRVDSVGRIQSTKVVKSSGSFAFDRAVEVAIARSAPLPMPPASDPANAKLQNINFPFRYTGL